MMNKYMILCVAGQSNAVGYDESIVDIKYEALKNDRIMQLGFHGEDNLKIIPLGVCAQNYQDMRPYSHPENKAPYLGTKGIHLPLAHLLLDYLPEDYSILVIPAAYGGTGFTMGEKGSYDEKTLRPEAGIWRWGVESPYYKALKARIAYALELNQDNKFLGMIWIQGEQDKDDVDTHSIAFEEMTQDFFTYFNSQYKDKTQVGEWNKNLWYNIETVGYWYSFEGCEAIWNRYKKWHPQTYVTILRDTDSNEIGGTGKTASIRGAHYGNNAYAEVIAPQIVKKMVENKLIK